MPIPSTRRFFYLFCPTLTAALVATLIPFLRYNNLLEWDFPGHYAAVWHLKEHLLPWPSGWNPYFYCGYPQGIFYPPLAHYAAAILAFAFGIAGAIKGLVALSVLSLPVAFYFFARRFGLEDLQAAVCATWMTALLFVSGEMLDTWGLGSDLRSTLNTGLFANALSLPVLFAFLASCGHSIQRNNWKTAAVLLGVLLLLHPLSSLVAGVFLVSVLISQWWETGGKGLDWKPMLWTPVLALMLGAQWLFPYLCFQRFMSPESIGAHWSMQIQFLVLNGLLLAMAAISKIQQRPLVVAYVLLANLIVVGTIWKVPLQFTRLTIYLLFLIPVFLLSRIRSRSLLLSLAAIALVVGVYGYARGGLNPRGVSGFNLPDFGPVQGRILSVTPSSHLPSYHVNHDLLPVRTGNESMMGLFIESSLNGRFLAHLLNTLEPEAYVWGTPTGGAKPELLGKDYPEYLRARFRLFDIRSIYTDLKLENILDPALARSKRLINSYPAPRTSTPRELEDLQRRFNLRGDRLEFYLYPVEAGSRAETLPYVPKAPGSDWKLTNQWWFLGIHELPIFTDQAVPAGVREARAGDKVALVAESDQKDRMIFDIRADQPIPVLVKVGYFPAWKLTLNGRPAPVYRASPNLILFFGQGNAVLEYRRPWQEYAGLILTALGFCVLFLL